MNDPFNRPLYARARRLCLALPETSEKSAWGHPNFRVGTKTFCAFELIKGRPSVAFRLPADAVDDVLANEGFATPYGRGLWASVWIDGRIDWKRLQALVELSYRTVAPKRALRAVDALSAGSPLSPAAPPTPRRASRGPRGTAPATAPAARRPRPEPR
jgi:predicted DNA-binding protein (MmcQ/YjbR family)